MFLVQNKSIDCSKYGRSLLHVTHVTPFWSNGFHFMCVAIFATSSENYHIWHIKGRNWMAARSSLGPKCMSWTHVKQSKQDFYKLILWRSTRNWNSNRRNKNIYILWELNKLNHIFSQCHSFFLFYLFFIRNRKNYNYTVHIVCFCFFVVFCICS